MAGRVFTVGARPAPAPLLSDPASRVWPGEERDVPISLAFATVGRIANPTGRACTTAAVFGRGNAPRNISGPPRGEAPAGGEVGKWWRDVGLVKPRRK